MKKTKFNLLLFLLIISVLFPIRAISEVTKFTLEDAIKIGLNNNKDVKIAFMNIRKAEAAVDQAFGYALPTVDFSASFSHYIETPKMPFIDFEAMLTNASYALLFKEHVIPEDESKYVPVNTALMSFTQANNYQAGFEVTQILFNSAVFRGIGASKIYLDLSKKQFHSSITKSVLDIKKAFYGVLLAKELSKILNDAYNNAQLNFKNVKALHTQGLVSDFDLLQTEVNVENIKPSLVEMDNMVKNTIEGLKIAMGIEQNREIEVVGEITFSDQTIPDVTQTIEIVMNNNLDLKSLSLKREVDDAYIDLDRSEWWPSVAAFGNYTFAGSSDNFKFLNYRSAMVGINLSINLFKGNQTYNKVQQSTITALQTDEQINQLKSFLSMQVKSTILEMERTKSLIESQNRNVNLAQRAYDLSLVRYKEGTGSQLEIQNSELALRQAKTNRLQTVYSYIVTQFQLDYYFGTLKDEYIEYVQPK
ncbi:MAG TPA: TolC family protein [Candidatus Kapabacteria bacterium]|nr:TolC family protein [Candidatus Kapabacteria bacterium]